MYVCICIGVSRSRRLTIPNPFEYFGVFGMLYDRVCVGQYSLVRYDRRAVHCRLASVCSMYFKSNNKIPRKCVILFG